MTLTLSVLRCPESVAPETRKVTGGEFTLGRGADSDWVLADPDRYLSKRHCALAFRAGAWQLADLSTNGTFLNRETSPVGRGTTRALRDGDRLKLGPYEIEVQINEEAPAPGPVAFASPASAPDLLDPFRDDPFAPPAAAPFATAPNAPLPDVALPPDFDPLVPDPGNASFAGPVQSDHNEAIEDAFRAPQPAHELLPDDWDLDAAPPTAPVAAPTAPPAAPPVVAPPVAPPVVPAPPATPASPRIPTAAPVPPGAGAATGGLLAAFLEGAGVASTAPSDPEAMMRALGATFRALVTGLRQILIARQAVKGEFRIEQTMVRARGNNPLKFSAGDDDALAALLGTGRHTDMGPAEAVADALADIRRHELASIAAMQSAVRTLLARFDPKALGGGAEHGLRGLGGGRKARAWDAFEKLHGETTAALTDDFDSVFGKAFARAYEQALADIAARGEPS